MLSKEQVDELFAFCEKHFVRHYDVKVELVDHLANAIEEKMAANSAISFEAALNKVYADFGVLGFAGIMSSHSNSLGIRYRKTRNRIFWSYFTWPKAAIVACIFSGFIFLRKTLPEAAFSYVGVAIFLSLWLSELSVLIQSYYLQKKASQKLLMMQASAEEPLFVGPVGGTFLIVFDWAESFEFYMRANTFWFCIITILVIVFFVGTLAYRKVVMDVYRSARKQYPEIFVAA